MAKINFNQTCQLIDDGEKQIKKTNENIRSEAENQLVELKTNYKEQIKELESRIEELEFALADCERIHTEKGVLLP